MKTLDYITTHMNKLRKAADFVNEFPRLFTEDLPWIYSSDSNFFCIAAGRSDTKTIAQTVKNVLDPKLEWVRVPHVSKSDMVSGTDFDWEYNFRGFKFIIFHAEVREVFDPVDLS